MTAQTTSTIAAYSGTRRAIRRSSSTRPGRAPVPSAQDLATGSHSTSPESTKNMSTNRSVPSIAFWAAPDHGQVDSAPVRLCW